MNVDDITWNEGIPLDKNKVYEVKEANLLKIKNIYKKVILKNMKNKDVKVIWKT